MAGQLNLPKTPRLLLRLCYDHARLRGRRAAGLTLSPRERSHLHQLDRALSDVGARSFRRLPVSQFALVRRAGRFGDARLHNLSSDGMFIVTDETFAVGEAVQVKVGEPGVVEFTYSCTVQRAVPSDGGSTGYGLAVAGIPLELRYRPVRSVRATTARPRRDTAPARAAA